MIKSLVEDDITTATDSFHQYLTNRTHSIVEKEEMEFDITMDAEGMGEFDDAEECDEHEGEFCTGCGEQECVCDDEAPFCGGCGCVKVECCCDGDVENDDFDTEEGDGEYDDDQDLDDNPLYK
jgi:hypothetical protein